MARTEIQIGSDSKQGASRINQKGVNDPHKPCATEQNIITINLILISIKQLQELYIGCQVICQSKTLLLSLSQIKN